MLHEHLRFVWEAWWVLSADRHVGMAGLGPIPFSAIDRYATRFGINDIDNFSAFIAAIAAMDDAYFAAQKT